MLLGYILIKTETMVGKFPYSFSFISVCHKNSTQFIEFKTNEIFIKPKIP